MSRFSDFSLYKRTDELLRPAEKELSGRFHATENIQLLYKKAVSEIDASVSYHHVTRTMDSVFRLAIQTEHLPSVSDMNTSVLRKLSHFARHNETSRNRYAERSFTQSNVPTSFLPRPSFSSHRGDSDGREDDTIELLRR